MDGSACIVCNGDGGQGDKLLKCFHVICSSCLRDGLDFNGSFKCPECDESTEPSRSGPLVETLPYVPRTGTSTSIGVEREDQSAERAADDSKVAGAASPSCQDCTAEEIVPPDAATQRCVTCRRLLCPVHAGLHPKRAQFRSHELQDLPLGRPGICSEDQPSDDVDVAAAASVHTDEDDTSLMQHVADGQCQIHRKFNVEVYCLTCNTLLCKRCKDTARCEASEHDLKPVVEAAKQLFTDQCRQFGVEPPLEAMPEQAADSAEEDSAEGTLVSGRESDKSDSGDSTPMVYAIYPIDSESGSTGESPPLLGKPTLLGKDHADQYSDESCDELSMDSESRSSPLWLGNLLEEATEGMRDEFSAMVAQTEQVSKEVTDHFQRLRYRLDKRERELLAKLDELRNKKTIPVEQRLLKLESASEALGRASSFLTALAKDAHLFEMSQISFLQCYPWLCSLHKSSQNVHDQHSKQGTCDVLGLEFHAMHKPLAIERTGHVRDSIVHPEQCEIQCDSTLSTGLSFRVKTAMVGSDNEPICTRPDRCGSWKATISARGSAKSVSQCHAMKLANIVKNNPVTMTASVQVQQPGTYDIAVEVEGRLLPKKSVVAYQPITWIVSHDRCRQSGQPQVVTVTCPVKESHALLLRAHQKFVHGIHRWKIMITRKGSSQGVVVGVETDATQGRLALTEAVVDVVVAVTLDCEQGELVTTVWKFSATSQLFEMATVTKKTVLSKDGYTPVVLGTNLSRYQDTLEITALDPGSQGWRNFER